ncbi:MAG: ABC transporter permease [Treponema sp.]
MFKHILHKTAFQVGVPKTLAFRTLFLKELYTLSTGSMVYSALLILYAGAALPFTGSGYWFSAGFSDFRSFFLNIPVLFCTILPLLTMNTWTDEVKFQTDRLLASYPVSKITIVLGKYTALLVCFTVLFFMLLCIPLSVLPIVYFDSTSFILSAAALFLFGAAIIALSLALSCITAHAAVSFLLSFFTGVFFTASHLIAQILPLPHHLTAVVRYCSFTLHFESAARGIFDTRDFVFYLLLTAAAGGFNIFILIIKEDNQ